MLDCKRCKGEGSYLDWRNEVVTCDYCNGVGKYPEIDVEALLNAIKGRKAGTLRSTMNSYKATNVAERRAYYVWRMARFHGGIDVTMPVMAALAVTNDPYIEELDKLSDLVATRVFGSNMRAAERWGRALGYF